MALRLYLDDSADDRLLEQLLRQAGHVVTTPAAAGLLGARDADHVAFSVANALILITMNYLDFERLYGQVANHPGAFVIRRDNDPARDMFPREVVRAIANLEASGVPSPTRFIRSTTGVTNLPAA